VARSTWSGYVTFGLVSIPVGLYTATSDQTIHFNQFHKGTSHRVRYKKVDEVTGEELDSDDIVNGFPIGDGEYVVVTREELKESAPGKSETIEIVDFVDLDEIDPKFFRQTYYLAPRGKGSDRAYSLLLEAMRETNKVGIGTVVLREKEHLVAARPGPDVLILETMYFDDEIRDASELISDLPDGAGANAREMGMAKQLIEAMSVKWEPDRYHDTYRERVNQLIESKRAGKAVVFQSEAPKSNIVDLMSALKESVERSRSGREAAPSQAEPARAAAGKATARGEQQTFEGMSKAELLERAAALDVKGRSKMTRPELVRALSEVEAPRQKRQRAS
jgi:DNA end-binding protein Ku